jgi:hypothetical protein
MSAFARRLAILLSLAAAARAEEARPLFDGTSLKGWHVSAGSVHSETSGHTTGGAWRVEDGAIVGTQDRPGNGGLLLTDASFGDVEISLEVRNDYGIDSGLFLRSSEAGQAYQCMIDYFPGGTIGGIYGEALPGDLHVRNFSFLDAPERIERVEAPFPLPVDPSHWTSLWHVGRWNRVTARIAGNPPHLTTAINGVTVMDLTDTALRAPPTGRIGLQLHGGERFYGLTVRYRAITVRALD